MSTTPITVEVSQWPSWAQALHQRRESGKGKPDHAPTDESLDDPPGFVVKNPIKPKKDSPLNRKALTQEELDELKVKKAWAIAFSIVGAKTFMQIFGMWMAGNTLQIFSIFMLVSLIKEPITAIASISQTFSKCESETSKDRVFWAKLVYILFNILTLCMGIWKIDRMGLLPNTQSDWLAWEPARQTLERAIPSSLWSWASTK